MSADALDADEVARAKITRSVADRSSCLWLARGTRWLSSTLNHEGALTDLRRRPMSKKAYAIAVAALLGAPPIAFAAQPVIVDVGTFLGMGGKRVPVKLSDFRTDNNR